VPAKYRPTANITKYGGETDPGLWLEDYRLACRTGGAESDGFIIRNPKKQGWASPNCCQGCDSNLQLLM